MDKNKLWECVMIVALGTICGIAGYLSRTTENGEQVTKLNLFVQALSASVSGCVVLLICMHYGLDMLVTGILTGFSGWIGGAPTMNTLLIELRSRLGMNGKGGGEK